MQVRIGQIEKQKKGNETGGMNLKYIELEFTYRK